MECADALIAVRLASLMNQSGCVPGGLTDRVASNPVRRSAQSPASRSPIARREAAHLAPRNHGHQACRGDRVRPKRCARESRLAD